MGLVIFFLLAAVTLGAIVYPLLPGRTAVRPAAVATDGDIERAVRDLRRARAKSGLFCPACGKAYQDGDRFCVRCGGGLPQEQAPAGGPLCPLCGAIIREGDRFCARCGCNIAGKEAA